MTKRICSFLNCGQAHKGHGLCAGHLIQRRKGKDLASLRVQHRYETCQFGGCENVPNAQGLCSGHYHQYRKGNELGPLRAYARAGCSVERCSSPHYSLGFCRKHYKRHSTHGDLSRGRRPSEILDVGEHLLVEIKGKHGIGKWTKIDRVDRPLIDNMSLSIDTGGYAHFVVAGKLEILHLLIMKPPKMSGLQVDHINGDRLDNLRSNLRIVTFEQQMQNKKPWASSGHRNVHWSAQQNKWRVVVKRSGKLYYGGAFDDIALAVQSARELRGRIFTHHVEERCLTDDVE